LDKIARKEVCHELLPVEEALLGLLTKWAIDYQTAIEGGLMKNVSFSGISHFVM
jgi:hypothetical protein